MRDCTVTAAVCAPVSVTNGRKALSTGCLLNIDKCSVSRLAPEKVLELFVAFMTLWSLSFSESIRRISTVEGLMKPTFANFGGKVLLETLNSTE